MIRIEGKLGARLLSLALAALFFFTSADLLDDEGR